MPGAQEVLPNGLLKVVLLKGSLENTVNYRGHWFSLAPSCLAAGEEVINGLYPVPLLKASTRPLWERCPALEERNKTRNHQEEPGQAGLADVCQL